MDVIPCGDMDDDDDNVPNSDSFAHTSSAYNTNTLGKLSEHPNLRKAWSDESSAFTSSSRNAKRFNPNHINADESFMSAQSINSNQDNIGTSFAEWVNYTNKLKNLVSKQIQECTNGANDNCDEDSYRLKDEDFFWNPNSQSSFDTVETNRTNRVKTASFSKLSQNITMWQSDRSGFAAGDNHGGDETGKRL